MRFVVRTFHWHVGGGGVVKFQSMTFVPWAVLCMLVTVHANAESPVVLVDFGASANDNTFGLAGWNTVQMDAYTGYVSQGPAGTTIVVGDNGAYNYQGVSGVSRVFTSGDRMEVTWYNHSADPVTFTPQISFDDPDRPASGVIGTWYAMTEVSLSPWSSGVSQFTFTENEAGTFNRVNTSCNQTNQGTLVCDAVRLFYPGPDAVLSVAMSGDGSGQVVSLPAGIDCPGSCQASVVPGITVELEAVPDPGSAFQNWGPSLGADPVVSVVMEQDRTVEALFQGGVPIADFSVDISEGTAPLTVHFQDLSTNNPSQWAWDFDGDGITDSTEQNPTHVYSDRGVFTVSLTASHGKNSSTKTSPFLVTVTQAGVGTVYSIGPGLAFESTHDVPLHLLHPGDVVRIHAKPDAEPYREKLFIRGTGTQANPIHIVGIPDAQGQKPVFYGYQATSNTDYGNYYWNEDRQVILVGQYGNGDEADHIILQNLEVHGAVYGDPFLSDTGSQASYAENATGIRVSATRNVWILDCDIHGNENGVFSSHTGNLTLRSCWVHDNGVHTASYHQHNLYLGGGPGSTVTVEASHLGTLLNDGQQAKFRTETVVFRYNWVDDGKNSLLDLVEDAMNGVSNAFVYGNVLIKTDPVHNRRMVHFGGDNASVPRSGTLYFFNNTCVVEAGAPVRLFQISEPDAHVVAHNNVFTKQANVPDDLFVYETSGQANLTGSHNFIITGTLATELLDDSLVADDPGLVDSANRDFRLQPDSILRDVLVGFVPPAGHELTQQYDRHLGLNPRPDDGWLDLGAYEYQAQNYLELLNLWPDPLNVLDLIPVL